jgi:hypothetical protein
MPQVKHAVFLRFKSDTPAATIDEIFADLRKIKAGMPAMVDFTGGPNNSPEGLSHGFTHGFVMTFADAAGRDAYLPDPRHESVKAKILAALDGGKEGVRVLDWFA